MNSSRQFKIAARLAALILAGVLSGNAAAYWLYSNCQQSGGCSQPCFNYSILKQYFSQEIIGLSETSGCQPSDNLDNVCVPGTSGQCGVYYDYANGGCSGDITASGPVNGANCSNG
ncbi:MAG TPA: hypothetical protein VL992_19250 [Tepidisphaeraceae bacterium]|nr:hypothetical protein [Tepidisphaeraceae bacterium]